MAASVPLETGATAPEGAIPPLGVLIASSWATISSAVCQRSAGRFSRQRMISALSASGTLVRWRSTGSGRLGDLRC